MHGTTDHGLAEALAVIETVWFKGPPVPDPLPGTLAEQERLQRILNEIVNAQNLALAVSRGDVSLGVRGKGLTLGCLKSLQANLRHLSWQTQMIAGGDLTQHVDFMGEFAEAFNTMVRSLAEARTRLQRRDAELSQTNQTLEAQIAERQAAEERLRQANETLTSRLAEIELLQAQLREQAIRDPLTNLFNRRYLQETLERELAVPKRSGAPLPVIMMDIDYFKRLNDQFGHKVGDLTLEHVADVLRQNSRRSDIACRYGGEEFVVVLPGASLDAALQRAEELRRRVEGLHLLVDETPLTVTLSLGVASYPDHGQNGDELLHAADMALYQAKAAGRNCIMSANTAPMALTQA